METWSVDQVCMWLEEKNLGELVPRFQEEEVSGAALLALNDRMVQQLVKKIGHQAVLMDFIKKYKQSSQGPNPIGGPRGTSLLTLAQAVPEHGQNSSHTSYEDQTSLYPAKNVDNRLIDPRVLKQRRNVKHALARHKALQWTKSYVLPEFPYDVKCMLAEHKSPDHSMRIRIIEFLQADVTKYLGGSLYPTTQQYNDVVNALLQAHPFLDEDGCGFFLWKRALKDRFKYVRRPIEDDEQVLRNKCKFGHRRGQTRKSLADMRANEIKIVQIKVHVSTPVLEVKNPFHIGGAFVFSLYLDQEKLTKLDDCVTALATLVAAFRVFGIECPRRQSQTLNFLETLSFNVQSPPFPSLKEKEIRSQAPIT